MPTPPETPPRPPTRQQADFASDPPPAAAVRFIQRMRDVPDRLAEAVDIAIQMEARRRAQGK